MEQNLDRAEAIIDAYGCDQSNLIAIMQEIQGEYKYLSEGALTLIAEKLGISRTQLRDILASLEREGFIDTLPGKGCFVAERSTELLREENLKKIEGHMQEIRRLASACRLTENELDEMWRLQKEEAE